MLRPDPRARATSAEISETVSRRYDALIAAWEPEQWDKAFAVAFMPTQSSKTVYQWGWIANDPAASDAGRQELKHFLEGDLRGAVLVHSAKGAERFVHDVDKRALREARFVLLGRQGAWFCVVYRRSGGFGRLGDENERLLLIKYVVTRDRAYQLEGQSFSRRISFVEAMPHDIGDDTLDARCAGRPSWEPLLKTVRTQFRRPEWEESFERATDWLLDLQDVETRAREYAFIRESSSGATDFVRLRFDRPRDNHRIQRHRTALFAMLAGTTRPSFGDFFGEHQGDGEGSGLLQYRGDDDGRPAYRADGQALWAERLDDDLIEIRRSAAGQEVPETGWIRPLDDSGSASTLRRQADARAELMATPGLLGQLRRPTTIQGLRHRWRRAGQGLLGGVDEIVKDMLVSQPFYALHGPPGTGKTTVVASAVDAFLAAERSARVLVSAQSNYALDNLAIRVLSRMDETSRRDVLAVRVAGSREDRVHDDMRAYLLEPQTRELAERIKNSCHERLDARIDSREVRQILGTWLDSVEGSFLELQDRLRRGANLVFATCLGATKRNVDAVGGFGVYDWVLVEEAARAWPTELAIPLARGVRWTLVGDHRQLPAHRRDDIEQVLVQCAQAEDEELADHGDSLSDYRAVFDLFGKLFEDGPAAGGSAVLKRPVGRLNRQFRMRGDIAEIVSRAFYAEDGGLETDPSAEVPAGLTTPVSLAEHPVVWIDTTDLPEARDQPRWSNPGEARFIAELLGSAGPRSVLIDQTREEPLAILTPWGQQAKLIINTVGPDFKRFVHTVSAFQGREAGIVIVSLVRDRNRGESPVRRLGFAIRPELVDVMLSRARRLLVIVGRYEHFASSGVNFWETICETVSDVGVVIPASESL